MSRRRNAQLDEIFALVTNGSRDLTDFPMLMKHFYPLLDNGLTFVDIYGVFTVASSDGPNPDNLDWNHFEEFFIALGKIKYPNSTDSFQRLLDDFQKARQLNIIFEIKAFHKMLERNVLRQLLKYDISLRRSFSYFAGHAVTVGGGLTWDEVKSRSIGMEADGYVSFAASFGIVPQYMNIQQCLGLAKDVLAKFPLVQSSSSQHSALLYPQVLYSFLSPIKMIVMSLFNDKLSLLQFSFNYCCAIRPWRESKLWLDKEP